MQLPNYNIHLHKTPWGRMNTMKHGLAHVSILVNSIVYNPKCFIHHLEHCFISRNCPKLATLPILFINCYNIIICAALVIVASLKTFPIGWQRVTLRFCSGLTSSKLSPRSNWPTYLPHRGRPSTSGWNYFSIIIILASYQHNYLQNCSTARMSISSSWTARPRKLCLSVGSHSPTKNATIKNRSNENTCNIVWWPMTF